MAIKTFYLKEAEAPGSSFLSLQDGGTAPATGTTGTGWTVGTTTSGKYSAMAAFLERAAGTFGATAHPDTDVLPNTILGDSWRSENTLHGLFSAGTWTFHFPVIAVTDASGQDGRIRARVWRGSDPLAADAVELTSAVLVGATVTDLATGAAQDSTFTWSPGAISLNNEYLFVEIAWETTGAATNAAADVLFRVGSTAYITTPDFLEAGSWRDHPHHHTGHLYIHPPATVFAAQVDAATLTSGKVSGTSIFQYIYVKTITTGALADIQHNQTLWLGSAAGLYDKGRARVKDVRNVGGTNVIAVWVSPNVHDGELALATDLYITVKDEYRPWMKPPYYPDSGVGAFDGDNGWGGTVYNQFPIANAGPAYAQFVDAVTSLITVSFDGSASFAAARRAVLGQYSADKTSPGDTITASSTNGTDVAAKAIDNNTALNNYWRATGNTNEWIAVTLPTAAVIRKFDLTAQGTNAPKNFWLQAYIDGVWQTVSLNTDQTGWGSPQTRSYYCDEYDGRSATQWRLWIYQNNGAALTAVNELALYAEDRVTTSPYTWDVGDGTITVGTTTSEQITATFPAGFRYVKLTVTDTNGYTGVTHVPVLAATATTPGLMDYFELVQHDLSVAGQDMEFVVYGSLDVATYPDNTLVLYWEDEVYNATAGSLAAAGPAGREHMKFTGWIFSEMRRVEVRNGVTVLGQSIHAVDIGGWLQELPSFPVVLMRKTRATPAYIYECDGLNIDRFIYLILRWLSNAVEITDFIWSGTLEKYPVEILSANGETIFEQADQLANTIGYNLTCNKHSQLQVKADPNRQATADRTATVIASLTADDLVWLEYAHEYFPKVHWVWTSGVFQGTQDYDDAGFGVTTYFAVSPWETPGQGRSAVEMGEQLVASSTELGARGGLLFARSNAPQDMFRLELAHGGDTGIDPAAMEWIELTLAAANSPRGQTITAIRLLPRQVSISYDSDKLTKTVQLELEKETDGPSAVAYTP